MSTGFEIVKIFIIVFILISLHFTHILCTQVIQVHKVSGEDENEQEEAFFVHKFRALLRLDTKRSFQYVSLSPSPAPAPAPVVSIHVHSHPHRHPHQRSKVMPYIQKGSEEESEDEGRGDRRRRRVLVPIVVSAGAVSFLGVLGLIWVCFKFKKHQKKSPRSSAAAAAMSVVFPEKKKKKGKSKYVKSPKSSKAIMNSTGLDLFYLNSLSDLDLEQQQENTNTNSPCDVKQITNENVNTTNQESDHGSGSNSTREITSVHEDIADSDDDRSVDGDGDGVKVIHIECHSSDDESFHSFVDSQSPNFRLSNASNGSSICDTPEILLPSPPLPSKFAPSSLAPPPPPPPPLPPSVARISALSKLSSTRESDLLSLQKSSKGPPPPPGIPPPPCPPPFLKKGPPPPPSLLAQYTPLGKDGTPLPKLKPLHWDKVRAAPDRSMVWDKLRSSSFEFDEEMIESLFGYNIQGSMKNDDTKSKTPSPSKHVLEPKRLQNITILSKALNVTTEQVCDALMKGEGLSLQQLEALVKMVPTKEEEGKLASYKGNINELGSAEKFVKSILNIPFAFPRVEVMLYRETFEDEVVHLRNSFSMLEEACKELRSSRLFLKLLEAVLKTGNRMNVGTIRGGARAFKLDALLKLADVKGTDGKTTLLHFVVQEIIRAEGIRVSDSIMGKIINQRNCKTAKTVEEREEDYRRMGLDLVSGLTTELYNVKKIATVDLDVLASSVSNLSEGMSKLHHLINHDLSKDERNNGKFVCSMNGFLKYAEKNLKELQEDESRVLLHVRDITEYFHGDVSKEEANPLRIFVIVRDFLGMLDHVCKELRSFKVPSSPFR